MEPPKMPRSSPVVPHPNASKPWAKRYRTMIAASASSILSTVASYPLDSVKTRLQAYDYKFQHFTDCVQHTWKHEGMGGFWRGALAPVASVTLVRTLSFSIYQNAKYKCSAAIGRATGDDEPLVVVNRPGSTPTPQTIACFAAAGATAGFFVSLVACKYLLSSDFLVLITKTGPFEFTKQASQISVLMANSNMSSMDEPIRQSNEQKGTLTTAKNIIKNRGYAGLYSGFRLHCLRDTVGTAIYFSCYESTKQILVKLHGANSPTSPGSVAIAGGMCGLVSWACIYPIDMVKTQYQRNCLQKNKGEPVKLPKIDFFTRKNYRGLGVSMSRSCMVNTIFFSSFEYIKKQINNLPDNQEGESVD